MAERTFEIRIKSDYPLAAYAVRDAGEKIACEIGWGDNNTTSIEVVETFEYASPGYIAGWEFTPGSQSTEELT
jgi:hypothetical protein